MPHRFPGFSPDMPRFFRALAKNNDREWFAPRKDLFERHVRQPLIELATRVNDGLRRFAPDNVVAEPEKALYRLYRDTRFSKDKTPYKDHLGVTYPRAGLPKHAGAGFYFSVSHREVEVAGGVYMPGPEEFEAIRATIAADPRGFLRIASDPKLRKLMGELQGQQLRRTPKAWEGRAPGPGAVPGVGAGAGAAAGAAAEYFKFKQLYWYVTLPTKVALGPGIVEAVLKRFRAMRAGVDWLNLAILAARANEEARSRPARPEPMW